MSRKPRKPTDIPDGLKSLDVRAILRRRGVYLKQRENMRLKDAALPLAKELVKKKRTSSGSHKTKTAPSQTYISFPDKVVEEYWYKQIANVKTLEEHFDLAVKRFLTDHVLVKALGKLQELVDNNSTEKKQAKALLAYSKKDVFDDEDESDLQSQAQINFEPLLQNMAVIAGQDANKLIGKAEPYIPSQELRKRVQESVEKFTKSMLDTDQKHLSDLITNGIEQGESIQQIRSQITEDFGNYSTMQAQRITRTEVMRAANQSTLDAFKQSGVVQGQQWVAFNSTDECADYDGKVETLDSTFYQADYEFTDGEPPLHPNCKCILMPVLIDSNDLGS